MATPTKDRALESGLNAPPTIVTATRFEYLLTRLAARHCRVIHAGMRLERIDHVAIDGPVVLCGLAGSLVPELTPGMVHIPDVVASVNSQQFACDAELVDALRKASKQLGFSPSGGRLLTAPHIVTGAEREVWAERGFVAADMEAALLAESGVAFATIRVILDSPTRSMSDAWEQPAGALLRPGSWRELGWLATAAPRYALRAACIASKATGQLG